MRCLAQSLAALLSATLLSFAAVAEPAKPSALPEARKSDTPGEKFERICQTLQQAAQKNDLPVSFLTKLIWQESRFEANAVSPVGARGVAQFMPRTAAFLGLSDPFDVSEAIAMSAKFLRDLNKQFGNLGLAAAAYNAGPGRVQDWLSGGRNLPSETQAYVRVITGHSAIEWRLAPPTQSGLTLPDTIPCPELVKVLAAAPESVRPQTVSLPTEAAPPPPAVWGLQLAGGPSQAVALADFRRLQKTYKSILADRDPLVLRSKAGRNHYWYRVRVAAASYFQAHRLCAHLRAAGGSCIVQQN